MQSGINSGNDMSYADYRWFESNGMCMAIDQANSNCVSELGLTPAQMLDVPDLLDAVLLADHEPLLQCLEVWTGHVFDWKPLQTALPEQGSKEPEIDPSALGPTLYQQANLPQLTVSLSSNEGPNRAVYLAIDTETLGSMPAFPDHWQSLVSLNRHAIFYNIGLHETLLTIDEQKKMVPGALILLAGSFADSWQLKMQAVDSTCNSISGVLQIQSNTIHLLQQNASHSDDVPAAPGAIICCLQKPVLINDLYVQSTWQSGNNALIKLPGALNGSAVNIYYHGENKAPLTGHVVSLGQGYGVLINEASARNVGDQE